LPVLSSARALLTPPPRPLNKMPTTRLNLVRRRIAKASIVFGGTDIVAARLYTLMTGLEDSGPAQGMSSLAEFNKRIGDAYMVKWQLLSSAIDHVCRWLFITSYVTAVATTAITLTRQSSVGP
jgi:hypothetical protein